jgi:hypothetical protein
MITESTLTFSDTDASNNIEFLDSVISAKDGQTFPENITTKAIEITIDPTNSSLLPENEDESAKNNTDLNSFDDLDYDWNKINIDYEIDNIIIDSTNSSDNENELIKNNKGLMDVKNFERDDLDEQESVESVTEYDSTTLSTIDKTQTTAVRTTVSNFEVTKNELRSCENISRDSLITYCELSYNVTLQEIAAILMNSFQNLSRDYEIFGKLLERKSKKQIEEYMKMILERCTASAMKQNKTITELKSLIKSQNKAMRKIEFRNHEYEKEIMEERFERRLEMLNMTKSEECKRAVGSKVNEITVELNKKHMNVYKHQTELIRKKSKEVQSNLYQRMISEVKMEAIREKNNDLSLEMELLNHQFENTRKIYTIIIISIMLTFSMMLIFALQKYITLKISYNNFKPKRSKFSLNDLKVIVKSNNKSPVTNNIPMSTLSVNRNQSTHKAQSISRSNNKKIRPLPNPPQV